MADKNIELFLKDKRASFLDIFEPKERKNDAGEVTGYMVSGNVLIPKTDPDAKRIVDAMKQALENAWPGEGMKIPPDRRCFRDGEPIDPDTMEVGEDGNPVAGTGVRVELYEGYAGHYYLSCNKPLKAKTLEDAVKEIRENNPVQILGTRKGPDGKFPIVRAGQQDAPYSGAYCNWIVRIYGYDGKKNGHPNRINCSFEAIQFNRHGQAFGAKPVDAQSQFEEVAGDDIGGGQTPGGAAASDDDDMLG